MSDQITYDNKVDLQVATNIANINKVTANDMNEIKNVVNSHADDIDVANNNITDLNNNKLDADAVQNEASTDTDKPYSADYLNDKLVSVGTTAPTDGRRVWFKKGKNLYNNALISASLVKNNTTVTYENEQIVMSTTGADAYFGTIVTVGKRWSEEYGQLISVEPNTNYTLSITNNVVDKNFITYYDENKVSIKIDYDQPYQVTFTTPNNAKYVSLRFGIANSTSDGVYRFNIQLEQGSNATSYEPYIEQSIKVDNEDFVSMSDLVSVGANQPTDGKRVWFKKSNNLLPATKYISTTTINGVTFTNNGNGTFNISGTATANKTIAIIPENNFQLEQGQAYYLYSSVPYNTNTFNLSIAMTDNGSLKFMTANSTYTPTAQPTQERLGIYIPNGTTVNATNVKLMLVKGNTAPSVYEPYVKPAIYVDGVKIYEMS